MERVGASKDGVSTFGAMTKTEKAPHAHLATFIPMAFKRARLLIDHSNRCDD
jgi:hypothetical protein